MNRRNFIKSGALFVPTVLTARKSFSQKLFDPNLGIGANATAALSSLNSDWLARILAAGGARPSDATFTANDVWYAALVSAGIDSRILVCNTYAPDNLIASITPLIKGIGADSWTNSGPFVNGDLTVNGLAGNGSSKYLQTGNIINSSGMGNSTNHMALIVSVDDRSSAQTEAGGASSATDAWRTYYHYSDNHTIIQNCSNFLDAGTALGTADKAGYLCSSRTSTTRVDIFFANTLTVHSSIYNDTGNVGANGFGVNNVFVHAANNSGTAANHSKKRISLWSCGLSLSTLQSLAFFNASNALRTSYGGGNV